VQSDLGFPVIALVRLEHLLEYLTELPNYHAELERLRHYQQQYGARDAPIFPFHHAL
jgi:orotate phosphoribosyltransferase